MVSKQSARVLNPGRRYDAGGNIRRRSAEDPDMLLDYYVLRKPDPDRVKELCPRRFVGQLFAGMIAPTVANIAFATFGSHGDIYPYLALGTELRQRGHRVTIASSAIHADTILAANLEFHAVRPNLAIDTPYFVDAHRGIERVVRSVSSSVRESYADTLALAGRADLLVTHPLTFGAVLAARKLKLPWVSTKLMPFSFASSYDPEVDPNGAALTAAAAKLNTPLGGLLREMSLNWVRPVVQLEQDLGLSADRHPFFEGSESPECSIILFSRYFADRQPDWPANAIIAGFAFYDQGKQRSVLPPGLRNFLDAGSAPAVFTLGSTAVGAAGDFYLQSLRAVESLRMRAVFLTGHHRQTMPEQSSQDTINLPYAPHAALFPRAAVIVHSGGIGTTAQAMRSGRPTLVVPFAFDHFDNAKRVQRLGLGEVLRRPLYNADRAATVLRALVHDPKYAQAGAGMKRKLMLEAAPEAAANAIEGLLVRRTHGHNAAYG